MAKMTTVVKLFNLIASTYPKEGEQFFERTCQVVCRPEVHNKMTAYLNSLLTCLKNAGRLSSSPFLGTFLEKYIYIAEGRISRNERMEFFC